MTGFSITFTGKTADDDPALAIGELRLGEQCEWFQAATGYWSVEDYQASWITALQRLLAGAPVSCLITSLTDPRDANFFETWPLYREGEEVFVQNRLLFIDQLAAPFAPDAPWESVDPRTTVDGKGRPVAEWRIALTDVENFLDSRTAPVWRNPPPRP